MPSAQSSKPDAIPFFSSIEEAVRPLCTLIASVPVIPLSHPLSLKAKQPRGAFGNRDRAEPDLFTCLEAGLVASAIQRVRGLRDAILAAELIAKPFQVDHARGFDSRVANRAAGPCESVVETRHKPAQNPPPRTRQPPRPAPHP